ncbi:unnamed protein product [Schistosoma margrebowiei]|uniref:Uncharacterized protein n=1 Tax=Schistosoma margrebowiei TaxID=48269 RepID=A0A183N5V5_9TREM|nr:unnamed protein product [Schistosoma margrebowiei]
MTSSDNLPLNELEKELLDPNSECYLENLLDVVSALLLRLCFGTKSCPVVSKILTRVVLAMACTERDIGCSQFNPIEDLA